MQVLVLPRLAGTREAVGDLASEQELASDLHGADVVVLGADLLTGSSSFADELVAELLIRRGAGKMVLVGIASTFNERLTSAAKRRDVDQRLVHRSAAEAGV